MSGAFARANFFTLTSTDRSRHDLYNCTWKSCRGGMRKDAAVTFDVAGNGEWRSAC